MSEPKILSLRETVDLLRPLASDAVLRRQAAELVAWRRVVSAGARVVAWRTGEDECAVETAD